MRVHVCACVHACAYVYMHVCAYACECQCTWMHRMVLACVYVHVCACGYCNCVFICITCFIHSHIGLK